MENANSYQADVMEGEHDFNVDQKNREKNIDFLKKKLKRKYKSKCKGLLLHCKNESTIDMMNRIMQKCKDYGEISAFDLMPASAVR